MRIILFGLFFVITIGSSFSQEIIKGTILDSESNAPLPYAYLINKNTQKGTITNEDGDFKLLYSLEDTIIVTFISYEKKEIPCSYFLNNPIYFLKPIVNELQTFEIFSNNDFLIDLLVKAKRKISKGESYNSKTYFFLESNINNKPRELIECYFNAEIKPSGFSNLQLKNGRIGMSSIDNNYFVSLNTTDVFADYNILYKGQNTLPINPLQLSKNKIKKNYNYSFIETKNGIYKIELIPKDNEKELFSAHIYIDHKKKQIIEIELFASNVKKHPFKEINQQDKLRNLNFHATYTFNNSYETSLRRIAFNYDFEYDNKLNRKQVNSNGLFLFYDKTTLFDLPYYSAPESFINDYDKIISQPYNDLFWTNNVILLPSKRLLELKRFFNENGVLLNFNKLTQYNSLFSNKIIPWSPTRIFSYDINGIDYNFNVDPELMDYHNLETTSQLYDFSAQIFLDRNVNQDSTSYIAQTLINIDKSFYHLKKNKNTTCFINLYFDQVEIAKRNMLSILNNKMWKKSEVDSIFQYTQYALNKNLKKYLNLVNHGKNEDQLILYIEKVKNNLQIDNAVLIEDEELKVILNNIVQTNKNIHIELYNYGSSLLKLKKYKEALDIFTKAITLGDKHPWLYYNTGLTYLALEDKNNACLFFDKSVELGEVIDIEVLKICND